MTTTEMANHLLEEMYEIITSDDFESLEHFLVNDKKAVDCSLIAVNSIMKSLVNDDLPFADNQTTTYLIEGQISYWEEVRSEIIKNQSK